jgi:hypothetical protein
LRQIKQGKPSLLNAVEDKVLTAVARKLAQLPAGVVVEAPKPPRFPEEGGPVLAATVGRFEDEGREAVMVVRPDGITRYSLTDPPLASDFMRLTGANWSNFFKAGTKITAASATAIDVNGDGLDDYLLLTDAGGVLLINRGFGAFLASAEAPKALLKAGIGPSAKLRSADAERDGFADLVVLSADGTIQLVSNPPHGKQ